MNPNSHKLSCKKQETLGLQCFESSLSFAFGHSALSRYGRSPSSGGGGGGRNEGTTEPTKKLTPPPIKLPQPTKVPAEAPTKKLSLLPIKLPLLTKSPTLVGTFHPIILIPEDIPNQPGVGT